VRERERVGLQSYGDNIVFGITWKVMTIRPPRFGETDAYRPWAETASETYSTQMCATEFQLTNQPTNQNSKLN